MADVSSLEWSGLAALGTLGSVCAVLLRSTHKNLESLEQMRDQATAVSANLREDLRKNDEAISRLQALCANYRVQIGALRAERRQLQLEIQKLTHAAEPTKPIQETKEGQ